MTNTPKSGFTAVEVFLVLTMLAIVVGILVVPAFQLSASLMRRPVDVNILSSVRKAHMYARMRNEPILMRYHSASNAFQLCSQDGVELETVIIEEINEETGASATELLFYRILPEDPKSETFAFELEEEPVEKIIFYPNGSSIPFAIQFYVGGDEHFLILDAFSSRPVLRMINGEET
jgi:hypothetical protein